MNYQEYLQSEQWLNVRRLKLNRARHKCQKCGFGNELDVHHLSYKNLGNEKDEDLMVLCRRCHKDSHYFEPFKELTEKAVVQMAAVTETEYNEAKDQKAKRAKG